MNTLPKVKLSINYSYEKRKGKDFLIVSLENKSNTIVFFTELLLFNKNTEEVILPVFWSENYFSILPNETREIKADYSFAMKNEKPELRIKGWNLNN